ncbi:helix-turn-helix domain-containing protein [Pseudozobellia sp. WGM2]|uniref:AraC family transcriptional regulator n=1 Tax=Pseudozobellia sp. WGM2 TaxID=2787625 RepID=UPI001ADFD4AC|nr:helix-turn-helix domain-containing protein [Pseudozobellia sp. WGM2]
MEIFESIKDLYMPVQPTVRQSAQDVVYREMLPDESLRNVIYCYWELKTVHALEGQFIYRVVSDGCIDIFFELNRADEIFVMGFCKKFTEFPLEHNFHYVGIRFLPTMFPQLFNIDATILSNRYANLETVHKNTAIFLSKTMKTNHNLEEIMPELDNYFSEQIKRADFNTDNRLYKAIGIILQNRGVVNLADELDIGISQRQLRRLFKFYIGDTAKTFSNVVRFQNILRAKPSVQSLKMNKLFFDVGYYDQAHFIKEFKNHYGVTPSRAFRG